VGSIKQAPGSSNLRELVNQGKLALADSLVAATFMNHATQPSMRPGVAQVADNPLVHDLPELAPIDNRGKDAYFCPVPLLKAS